MTLYREFLGKHLKEKKKHDIGNAIDILPFSSRKAKEYRTRFHSVLGELIRIICDLEIDNGKINKKELYFSEDENRLSEFIASNVEFENDDHMFDFIRFLDDFLFNNNEIKPIHPFLFNYIEIDKKPKNETTKFSQFIYDVLIGNNPEIKNIFSDKTADDILTELVLSKLDSLKVRKSKKKSYMPLMDSFVKLYQEDITFLSQYKDYFLSSFPLLTQYYTFMYVCQLIIKFEQFTNGNLEETQPLYFALDWESINKRRLAASDLQGLKYIKNKSINLFPHVHTLSQLSHNSINKEAFAINEKLPVYSYHNLYQMIKTKGEQYENRFFDELNIWIQEYQEWIGINVERKAETLPDAFQILFNCLKQGMNTDVCKKWGENVFDLGAANFIKIRGSLGQILNVKQEFLLLITAVSVKDKRIPLNELFIQFEKRGIAFDRYTKKEIITKFDNLNILDKKSDSGDSQYVKPIL